MKIHIRHLMVLAFCYCAIKPSFAELNNSSPTSKGIDVAIGFEVLNFNYLEPDVMQMEGPAKLFSISFSERINDWTGHLELANGQARVDYESIDTGQMKGIEDTLSELRLGFEHHLNLGEMAWQPSVYFGWAQRKHKNNFMGETTTGHQAYKRSNRRSYLPLRFKIAQPSSLESHENDGWSLGIEYRHVLSGKHTTHLTDVGAEEDNTSKQKGHGWRLQIEREIGDWRFMLYTNQWDMKATAPWRTNIDGVTYTFKEPANETRETGLRITRLF